VKDVIFRKTGYRLGERLDVMVVGIGVLSTGVTLTAANDTVMIPETFNPTQWIQAEGRTNRPGQTADSVNVYYLASRQGDTGRLFKIIRLKWGLAVEAVRALEDRREVGFEAALKRANDDDLIAATQRPDARSLVMLYDDDFNREKRAFLEKYIPARLFEDGNPDVSIDPLDGLVHQAGHRSKKRPRDSGGSAAAAAAATRDDGSGTLPPEKRQRISVKLHNFSEP
jgi:hypothetical protein